MISTFGARISLNPFNTALIAYFGRRNVAGQKVTLTVKEG